MGFLIYRVELKGKTHKLSCPSGLLFLIYRVELKVYSGGEKDYRSIWFLIYRVELKGRVRDYAQLLSEFIPNLPCGVESIALLLPLPQSQ